MIHCFLSIINALAEGLCLAVRSCRVYGARLQLFSGLLFGVNGSDGLGRIGAVVA